MTIGRSPDVAFAFGSLVTLGLCVAAVVILVRQWRSATPPERRSLVPLFAAAALTFALVAAYAASQVDALLWMAFAAFAATPFAFLAGLARADLSGSRGVRMLMAELGEMPERADLRDGLARALGDPALELAFWMPELTATWTPAVRRPSCRAGTTPPDRDGDPPSRGAGGRHRARPRTGPGDGARGRRRHGAPARQPAPRRRAARPARRAARFARPASWRRPTTSAGESSATCTTARSRGSWRSR